MKYFPQQLPLKGLTRLHGEGFLPVNGVMSAANRQRESSSSGNAVPMSPGALEHSEGTISLAQHREGEDRFGPWWCHPGMTFSESLCPQQQKSAELPRQE